jgi:hypothetical protein
MTITLRSWYPTATRPGDFRNDAQPLSRWPEAPRYCPSCGCRIARDNRAKICTPCTTTARIAHDKRQAWLHARGLL